MATPEEEEDEYTLATFDDVQGFRVPPATSAMGHKYVPPHAHSTFFCRSVVVLQLVSSATVAVWPRLPGW